MRAMKSEENRVRITVIGMNLKNSPTLPVQNSNGKNTLSVVAVEAMIGHAIRLAA